VDLEPLLKTQISRATVSAASHLRAELELLLHLSKLVLQFGFGPSRDMEFFTGRSGVISTEKFPLFPDPYSLSTNHLRLVLPENSDAYSFLPLLKKTHQLAFVMLSGRTMPLSHQSLPVEVSYPTLSGKKKIVLES